MNETSDKNTKFTSEVNFELITRLDERVRLVLLKQEELDKKIYDQMQYTAKTSERITILEAHDDTNIALYESLDRIQQNLINLEKRVYKLEQDAGTHNERWKNIGSFILQLVWVILAAYVLTKLNLQSPAVP